MRKGSEEWQTINLAGLLHHVSNIIINVVSVSPEYRLHGRIVRRIVPALVIHSFPRVCMVYILHPRD
jgi:hypothetical protein